jgi:hypothetical protein
VLQKNEYMATDSSKNEQLTLRFLGFRLQATNPGIKSIIILLVLVTFFLLLLWQAKPATAIAPAKTAGKNMANTVSQSKGGWPP